MSSEASAELIKVINEVLAPLVRADGGELYVVTATMSNVELHLAGRFSGCPGNTLVARRVVEPLIRKVAPDARVSLTSGRLVPAGARPAR